MYTLFIVLIPRRRRHRSVYSHECIQRVLLCKRCHQLRGTSVMAQYPKVKHGKETTTKTWHCTLPWLPFFSRNFLKLQVQWNFKLILSAQMHFICSLGHTSYRQGNKMVIVRETSKFLSHSTGRPIMEIFCISHWHSISRNFTALWQMVEAGTGPYLYSFRTESWHLYTISPPLKLKAKLCQRPISATINHPLQFWAFFASEPGYLMAANVSVFCSSTSSQHLCLHQHLKGASPGGTQNSQSISCQDRRTKSQMQEDGIICLAAACSEKLAKFRTVKFSLSLHFLGCNFS